MREGKNKSSLKVTFKLLGVLFVLSGITLAVFGFIDFFTALADGSAPSLFLCSFFGILILGIGVILSIIGFSKEVSLSITKESISSAFATSVHTVSHTETDTQSIGLNEKLCPSCGAQNDLDSKFCKLCGKAFE